MIVPSPPQTPNQHKNNKPTSSGSPSSCTSADDDEKSQQTTQKKTTSKKPLDRKSSSFALVATNKLEDERDKLLQELHNQQPNNNNKKTVSNNNDGLDEDELLERQLERASVRKHAEFIRARLTPALMCWRAQFTSVTEDLLIRLAVPHSKLWDRQSLPSPSNTLFSPPSTSRTTRTTTTASKHSPISPTARITTKNNNNKVSGGGGIRATHAMNVSAGFHVNAASQFDETKMKNLQDNRNVLDFQLFLASLEHSAETAHLPFSSLIPNSFKGTTDTGTGVLIQQPKTEEDFLAYEHTRNLTNSIVTINNNNTPLHQSTTSSSSNTSSIESKPHVIVTSGALFAFEEHLCSLFDPPYDALCRRAIQELQPAIYYDGQRAIDRTVNVNSGSGLGAGKSRADLLSSRYVQLTWCQMFAFLLAKVKTAKTMISFKQNTLNGQLSLLDRTVDRWRRATSIRLLREWYDYTRKQVYLRKRYREMFVALSSTAATRRAITRWKLVCRMARDRVEAEADAARAAAANLSPNSDGGSFNNNNNNNMSTFNLDGTTSSANNNLGSPTSTTSNAAQSHAQGMALATVRALQGQLVVRGSMLDHLSTVVKQLRTKSEVQQEVVESTLKKQAKVLHQFRSLKNALYPVPVGVSSSSPSGGRNRSTTPSSIPQGNLTSTVAPQPYRSLSTEEWEVQMRKDMENRVWKDQQQQQQQRQNIQNNQNVNNINSANRSTTSRLSPTSTSDGAGVNNNNPAFGTVVIEELEDENENSTSVASQTRRTLSPPNTTSNDDQRKNSTRLLSVTSSAAGLTSMFVKHDGSSPGDLSSGDLSRTMTPSIMAANDPYSPTLRSNDNKNSPNSTSTGAASPIRWPEVLASSPQTCTRASHLLVRVRHLISVLCVFISALQKDVVKITGADDSSSASSNNNNTKNRNASIGRNATLNNSSITSVEVDSSRRFSSSFRSVTSEQSGLTTTTKSYTNSSFRMPAKLVAHNANTSENNSNYLGDPHSIVATFLQEIDLDHNEKLNDEMSFVRALLSAVNRIAFAGLYQYPNVMNYIPSTTSPTSTFGRNNTNNDWKNTNNNNDIDQNIQMMNAVLMHVSSSGTYSPPDDKSNNGNNSSGDYSSTIGGGDNKNDLLYNPLEMFPLFLPTSSFAKAIEFDNPAWVSMMKVSLHALFALTPMSIPKLMLLSMIEGTSSSSPKLTTTTVPSSPSTRRRGTVGENNTSPSLLSSGALTADHRAKSMKNLKNFRKKAMLNSNQQQQQQEEADKRELTESLKQQQDVQFSSRDELSDEQNSSKDKDKDKDNNQFGISINRISVAKKQILPTPPMPAVSELRREWERAEQLCKDEHRWLMDTCERNYSEKAREIVADAFDEGQTSQLVTVLFDKLLRCNPRLRHNVAVEVLAHKLRIVFGEDPFMVQQGINNSDNNHDNNNNHHHQHDSSSVTSTIALEQLRQSYHAAAVHHHHHNSNDNNSNASSSFRYNSGTHQQQNQFSSGALAPSGSLGVGPIGGSGDHGSSNRIRYPSSLSANKGQWKAVLQNRKRHFINDSKDLEFVLHSIAKVMLLELPALVEKIEATFDDTDLFFYQITSQELRTILLEHEKELGHLFLLSATKRRETSSSLVGNQSLGDGEVMSPPGSFKFTSNNSQQQQQQKKKITTSPQSPKQGSFSSPQYQQQLQQQQAPSLLLMTRDDFASFCKPWCDAFLSMGMVHEIFIKTVQRYDEDARSITMKSQQSQLLMNHELFPFAVAMIAATKNPSPFVPLRVKVQQFMERQIVPMATSVMLGGMV